MYLKKEHFQELINVDSNDFRLCPKLNSGHVDVRGNERQRVKTATELFSDSVSKALVFKFGSTYSDQAKIISTVDAWFDVMNSRTKYHYKKHKCALGKTLSMP